MQLSGSASQSISQSGVCSYVYLAQLRGAGAMQFAIKVMLNYEQQANTLAIRNEFDAETALLSDSERLPPHRFVTGDAVTACRGSPLNKRYIEGQARLEGMVVGVRGSSLRVKVTTDAGLPDDVFTGLWRLDRGSNAVSTERQKQALQH